MKRTTIYLDPDLETRLQHEAMQLRKPMAEIIRQALREYLDKRTRELPPGEGAFDSGRTDTAERAEEVLSESGFGQTED